MTSLIRHRIEKLESRIQRRKIIVIVGENEGDADREEERLRRRGELDGAKVVIVTTGVPRPNRGICRPEVGPPVRPG